NTGTLTAAEVHGVEPASDSPWTTRARPPQPSTALGTSIRTAGLPDALGTNTSVPAQTAAAIGTLMYSDQRQLRKLASRPLRMKPTMAPVMSVGVKIPNARARARSSVNRMAMSAREEGTSKAPNAP